MSSREELEKLTVKELQQLLKNANQPTAGKKAELIERILALNSDEGEGAASATDDAQEEIKGGKADVSAAEEAPSADIGEKRGAAPAAQDEPRSPKRVQQEATEVTSPSVAPDAAASGDKSDHSGEAPAVRCVCIEGLVRPLSDAQCENFKGLIYNFGGVTDYFMSVNKSFVVVAFNSTHSASSCVSGMNGVRFPDPSRQPLRARIVPLDSIQKARETGVAPPQTSLPSDVLNKPLDKVSIQGSTPRAEKTKPKSEDKGSWAQPTL